MKHRMRSRGFSLLELVAVVTLIGIVAAVTMYRLNSVNQTTAKNNVAKQNVNLLQTATERHYFDLSTYPANAAALVTAGYMPAAPTGPTGYTYSIAAGIWSYSSGS